MAVHFSFVTYLVEVKPILNRMENSILKVAQIVHKNHCFQKLSQSVLHIAQQSCDCHVHLSTIGAYFIIDSQLSLTHV